MFSEIRNSFVPAHLFKANPSYSPRSASRLVDCPMSGDRDRPISGVSVGCLMAHGHSHIHGHWLRGGREREEGDGGGQGEEEGKKERREERLRPSGFQSLVPVVHEGHPFLCSFFSLVIQRFSLVFCYFLVKS